MVDLMIKIMDNADNGIRKIVEYSREFDGLFPKYMAIKEVVIKIIGIKIIKLYETIFL
jgi:hypothetical protein